MDSNMQPLVWSGGGLVVLGVAYFVLRFTLSRKTSMGPVGMATPLVDRRNREALEEMTGEKRKPADGAVPGDLLKAVEESERGNK